MALAGRALASPSVEDDPEVGQREAAVTADEEIARSTLDVGSELFDDSLDVMSGLVDITSFHDAEARHRASGWGRLDLVLAWRRTDRLTSGPASALVAMPGEPKRRDEIWLVATWRN